jgi:hypothetical protein
MPRGPLLRPYGVDFPMRMASFGLWGRQPPIGPSKRVGCDEIWWERELEVRAREGWCWSSNPHALSQVLVLHVYMFRLHFERVWGWRKKSFH